MSDLLGYIFLQSSFELVIVIKIAILTLSFGIYEPISVRTCIGVTVSSVFMITVVAHALRVVLLIFVRAFNNFHCFAFEWILLCKFCCLFVLVTYLRITNWLWDMLLRLVGSGWVVCMSRIIITTIVKVRWSLGSLAKNVCTNYLKWSCTSLGRIITSLLTFWKNWRGTIWNDWVLNNCWFNRSILY